MGSASRSDGQLSKAPDRLSAWGFKGVALRSLLTGCGCLMITQRRNSFRFCQINDANLDGIASIDASAPEFASKHLY